MVYSVGPRIAEMSDKKKKTAGTGDKLDV